ncbi:MAG: glycosyltransferase [Armatimonadota bacterium]|nr:glycosyltransferase [Armatimonadota bacterium]
MRLSVLMITYNHAKYIRKAIDSVLSQETNFDFEIVVGDDCSTDGTREIINEYIQRYPNKMVAPCAERNIGANRNFTRSLVICRGQYIALLDGDDYWTSPRKLQTQVDYLDSHPEYIMCFHDVENIFEDCTGSPVYIQNERPETMDIEDILKDNFIPTSSVVFRNGFIRQFPDWYCDLPFGDWPFFIILSQFGKIGYINQTMGAYRRRTEAATAGGAAKFGPKGELFLQGELKIYRLLDNYFHGRYRSIIRPAVSRRYYLLSTHFEKIGNLSKAKKYALYRLATRSFNDGEENILKHLFRLYMPGVYGFIKALRSAMS